MLSLISLILLFVFPLRNNAHPYPPSPDYYPSSEIESLGFQQLYQTLWGPHNQALEDGALTMRLDKYSGSGFKSVNSYKYGYFGADIKLQGGKRTAGVDTSLYLSSKEDCSTNHDEIDIEFLGNVKGRPYVLQTNVITADGNKDREMRFHLWFDPSKAYHHYAILWSRREIIFLVDDIPIRKYRRRIGSAYPTRPMYVYGSIWDASSWATSNGKNVVDYRYAPFTAEYTNFKIRGCDDDGNGNCNLVSGHPPGSRTGLSTQQQTALKWVQHNYMIYNYCTHGDLPECFKG